MACHVQTELTLGMVNPELIPVHNPITGAVIDTVVQTTREEISRAVDCARAAQPAWMALGVDARVRLLSRWADALWENRAAAMRIIRQETGKNDSGAFLEVLVIDKMVSYYARHARRWLSPQTRPAFFPVIQRARVYYKPHGVVGLITPWNYPLNSALIDLIPALIAGNVCLLKPSEIAPLSARYAVDLMHAAGIPRDVVQVLTGDGSTGAALVEVVDYVSFTGSIAVGRTVAARCGERLIPYSLELGGKDPLIVLDDADLDLAAAGALRGAFENAGQACISVERVYVETGIYDSFVERIQHYVSQMTIGAGDGFGVHMGSLTNIRELDRTEAHIADAVAKGAKLLCGGKRRPDLGALFFAPTVLVDVDHTMDIMRDETFGPVLPIMRVKDADEAIHLANDSHYGLSASIFTRDLRRGEQLATRLDCGDVTINRTQLVIGVPSLPMGGQKQSGVGRRGGVEGLLRFVTTQSVAVDTTIGSRPYLTYIEPLLYRIVLLARRFRRILPFG